VKERLRAILHPFPEAQKADTSLRYTDILFGFVIRELFLRLQNWPGLDIATRLHLVAGTVLVLGSWIGYRRSLNRSTYEVKFFNLPLFKFVADQLMLISYFQVAVLTPVDGKTAITPEVLASQTVSLIVQIFVLYLIWDALGIWMAKSRLSNSRRRYPVLDGQKPTDKAVVPDWKGFLITAVILAVLVAIRILEARFLPWGLLLITIVLLLGYRLLKEIRTSWRSLTPHPTS